MTAALLEKLGMRHPIVLAPLSGGPSTPELVAAVSGAGGLGTLGAAYLTPEQITEHCQRIRELTDHPFAVNLFAGGDESARPFDPGPMLAVLERIHDHWDLPPPRVLPSPMPDFAAQLERVLEACPAAFSFTFGIPSPDALQKLRDRGILILGTATTAGEAQLLADAEVDGVIVQGGEAGGHRGTFAARFADALVPTLDLVREVFAATPVPVIASGGIMDGQDIAACLRAGANAVQMGTAFLACPESGASAAYKKALLSACEDTTVVTRAYSGRPARGLRNGFIQQLEGREEIILPYPVQNGLTRPMRTEAARRGDPDYLSLWAGTGVTRIREMSAADLVQLLAEELRAVGQG